MILICTVLFYFSFLNHVYSALQLLVLDFLHAFRCFNIQSAPPASRFWTSSVSHSASTSNPRFQLPGFGLLPCLTLLQRPIHSSGFPVLDFFRASLRSNVQFTLPASRFWTSSVPHSASTSNPRFQLPGFGLLPCLTLLQRPIHSSGFPVLDFFRASLRFNVQLSLPDSHRFFNCFHQPTIAMLTSFNYPILFHARLSKLFAAGRTNAIHWDFT